MTEPEVWIEKFATEKKKAAVNWSRENPSTSYL